MVSCFLKSRVSADIMIIWEDKSCNHKHPRFPEAFNAEHNVRIPLWSIQVSSSGHVPSQLLVHPQVHTQGVWEHLTSIRGKASLLPCQLLNGSVGEGERVWEVVAEGVLLLHPSDKKMKPLVPSPSHPSCILFLPFLRV